MRFLVTGARGMLGRDLCTLAESLGHEAWPTDVASLRRDPKDRLDVTDFEGLARAIDAFEPDAVLHLAAMTHVDDCERFPDEAYRVNAVGTQNVAVHCQTRQLPLLYVSTGSVFDGTKPDPYDEFDTPNPVSVYGRSKYQGELSVREHVPNHFIVRAGWMFGGGPEDKKFVAKMIDIARASDSIRAVVDKFGSPSYTKDFAARCLDIFAAGRFGTYHGANAGYCSRFEMAKAIVEDAGLSCRVEPCSSAEFPAPAHRPRLEAIDGRRARLIGLPEMRPWREALREYVRMTFSG